MTTVTFVSYDKPDSVGGPFSWLRRLLPSLRERNIDVRGLFLTHYGGTGPVVEGLRRDGINCRVVDCHDRTEDQTRWILNQLRQNPPDVFVPNLVVSAYHASRWVREAGIPTVGVLHSDDDYYRAIQSEFVFGRKHNRLSGLVCVSSELEDQVNVQRPADTTIQRIAYGVPVPNNTCKSPAKTFRLAYVGRLAEEQKQVSLLTEALIKTCKEVDDVQACLFGNGPDRKNVESILNDSGSSAVTLGGNIPNERIQDVLSGYHAVVLLSDYEGLPIALLEAMACGCVPICLNMRSGIPELIADGKDGIVVKDRSDSFVQAVRRLSSDTELWRRMSRAAREKIETTYSIDACADQWAAYLESFSAPDIRSIRIPRRLSLAPRNPDLESEAKRIPEASATKKMIQRLRKRVGAVKRTLLTRRQ